MTPREMAAIHAACFSRPRPWSEPELAEMVNSPECLLTTCSQGFAIFRIAGPEAELLTIAVHPDAQRKGFAHQLLQDGLKHLKAKGCEEVFLEVNETNTAGRALYAANGFAQTAIRKDYYSGSNGLKINALVLKATL